MKKIYTTLLLTAALCAACNTNDPDMPSGGGRSSEASAPKVSFTIEKIPPLSVRVTDYSEGNRVVYDFGEGKGTVTVDPGKRITHYYSDPGDYVIKATAYNSSGAKAELHKSVTVTEPRVIVSGFGFIKIGWEDNYYRVVLEDSGPIFKKKWVNTAWSSDILYSAILPLRINLENPVELSTIYKHTYYTLYVYRNTRRSGDGTQSLKQQIPVSEIMNYPEYIEVHNNPNNTVVRVIFDYK